MNLKGIAERYAKESFEAFNETTQTFEPIDLKGRVSLVDRFQSIYNKPLRRRTLFHRPDVTFPDSLTVREVASGEVYLMGQRRTDVREPGEGAYHEITVLHLVTHEPPNSASGVVEVHRRVAQGPAEDPGWLVDTVTSHHFADFEFRTSSKESGTYDFKVESFVVHLPRHADVRRNDFLVLDGRWMRVEDSFPDSGFLMCRADEEPDSRLDFVLRHRGGRRYDENLMRYVDASKDYNVTGEVVSDYEMGTWLSESASYIDVVIDQEHVGVEPDEGDVLVYEGVERTVRRVEEHAGRRQYQLRCD